MTGLFTLMLLSPEEIKIAGIVVVMATAIVGALLAPIARAYARRMEGNAPAAALREELAEIRARLESLDQGQERMAELEARVDFAERLLAQQRDRDPARLAGQ
jgi:Tfp pilus assembly protein PilN